MNAMRRGTLIVMAALALAAPALAQPAAAREAHGALDAYAGEGVALAWAVLRGRDDASARVIVRVEADPGRSRAMSVSGVDPFTRASIVLVAPTEVSGPLDLAIARAGFADHPRTEWRFYAERRPDAGTAPAFLVYYQGVPDTAPEFVDPGRLQDDLSQRIRRVRDAARGGRP